MHVCTWGYYYQEEKHNPLRLAIQQQSWQSSSSRVGGGPVLGFLCPNLKSFKMLILSLIPRERYKRPTSQGGPDHSLGSPNHSKILMVFLSSDNLNFWCFWFSDMEIYLWITLKTGLAVSTRRWEYTNVEFVEIKARPPQEEHLELLGMADFSHAPSALSMCTHMHTYNVM
jgi:hypothetical protein